MPPKKTNKPYNTRKRAQDPSDNESSDEDIINQAPRPPRRNIEEFVASNRAAAAASGGGEAASQDDQNPGEESGDEVKGKKGKGDKGKGKAKKDKDGDGDKKGENKPKAPRKSKIEWTADNDRKLLLIMFTSPDKCKGSKHLQEIANMFREKPSPKAIAVRISKLRGDGLTLMGISDESQDKDNDVTDADDDDIPVNAPLPTQETEPTVELGGAIFGNFPVTWGDLDADLRKQVKDAASKKKQEMDWEAAIPKVRAMHIRNYAKQLAREEEARKEEAARALIMLRNNGGSGSGPAAERPETELEHQTRVLLEQLTNRGDAEKGQKGKGKGKSAPTTQEAQETEEDLEDADGEEADGDEGMNEGGDASDEE